MSCDKQQDCRNCNRMKEKINAPSMAYYTVYNKYPEEHLTGRSNYPKKIWQGKDVDANLEDKWLEDLNALPVEIKSTDAGKDKVRVAFVIFRMPEGQDDLYQKMEEELKKSDDFYISSNIGTQGRPRICIAKDISPENPEWADWWGSLAGKIDEAYKIVIGK